MSSEKVSYYEFGACRLDIDNHQLTKDGKSIILAQKAFEILCFLIKHQGKVIRKEELLETFWEEEHLEETLIAQQIYRIRKAIKDTNGESYIETVPKYGYRFTAEVKEKRVLSDISDNSIAQMLDIKSSGQFEQENFTFQPDGFQNRSVNGEIYDAEHPSSSSATRVFQRNHLIGIFLISLVACLVFTYFYFSFNKPSGLSDIKSIAVLPFTQIGEDQNQKLGLGVADTLISRISNQKKVSVTPTSTIVRFTDNGLNTMAEIGKTLEVDAVLNGTIQLDKGVARINVQLVRVNDSDPIWADKFDVNFTDIFSLQDIVSETVAQKLPMQLYGVPISPLIRKYTANAEAFQAYWMGFSYWSMHSSDGFENAIKQFNKAIEKDPKFVLAYAYLADSYGHNLHLLNVISKEEALLKGEEAAKKALELDSNSAEAMSALGFIYAQKRKQTKAFNLLKKSVEIEPNDSHARHRLSWMYASMNNIEKAVEEARYARNLDPQSSYLNLFAARMFYLARKFDESKKYLQKTLDIDPKSFEAKWKLVEILEEKGEFHEAEKEIKKLQKRVGVNNKSLILLLSRIYAKSKKTQEAKKMFDQILAEEKDDDNLTVLISTVYLELGEEELALERIKSVVNQLGYDNFYSIKYDPNFDSLRKNPAFLAIIEEKEKALGW